MIQNKLYCRLNKLCKYIYISTDCNQIHLIHIILEEKLKKQNHFN